MTTYILSGYTFTVDNDLPDDENATTIAPSEVRVVFNQGVAPDLTYTIKESFDDSSPFVNITSETIDVRFDGVSVNVDDQFDQDGEDEIGRLVWDGGDKVTDYLLTGIEDTLYLLRLAGDPFPDFGTDVDAFNAFTQTITDNGQAPSPFGPGDVISFADFPGAQITEDDEVDGTDDGDEIYVGLGDDTVRGNEGDDDIAGGDGRDMLSGGDDRDTIDGGAGSDTIDGGAGDDILTGGVGTVQTGDLSNALVNFGPGAEAGSWASQESVPRLVGDIDGDGTADVVGFGGARTFTSLNDGTGTLGDLAAGVDNFAQAQQWLSQDGQTRLLGDVDGDGDDDIIGFGGKVTFTAFSDGDGTFSGFTTAIDNFSNGQGWRSDNDTPRIMGDVNGDGIDDIIGFGGKVTFTALGQGDGTFGDFTTAIENFSKGQGWASNDTFLRLSGDVNGDGQDDIIGFGVNATYTAISNGDGTFGDFKRGIDNFAQSQGWGDNDSTPRLVGDVNGDGLADIIGFGGSTTFAALGAGDGTFGAIETLSQDFNRGSGWTSFDALPRAVADMNGDGTDDLIGFSSKGVLVQTTGVESDVFVFNDSSGQDTITDFGAGPAGDQIDVSELGDLEDLDDILSRATQTDDATLISYSPNMLRLEGVDMNDLTDANFIFA